MALDVKYETGVVWQDFQHKQLIDLFEQIKKAKDNQKDENLYRYTVAFLATYVNHHFKLEEKYMEEYKYPGREKHAAEHAGFVKELQAFRKDNYEYSQEGADELLTRMGEWILDHILGNDITLGAFILSHEKDAAVWEGK
jgi:hemerythrin-like metal-binding protein